MINPAQAWSAGSNNTNEWVQMELKEIKTVTGVQIQGRYNVSQWVKTFRVSYSTDGTNYTYNDSEKIYTVPTQDSNTINNIFFDSPVTAKYIKIHPLTWNSHNSMRCGVLTGVKQIKITNDQSNNILLWPQIGNLIEGDTCEIYEDDVSLSKCELINSSENEYIFKLINDNKNFKD